MRGGGGRERQSERREGEKAGRLFLYIYSSSPVSSNITSFAPDDGVYIVNVTDPLTFTCTATGVPAPSIQWLRNGSILDSTLDPRVSLSDPTIMARSRELEMVARTLTINATIFSDNSTKYTCVASHVADGGTDIEAFSVFVQGIHSLSSYERCVR